MTQEQTMHDRAIRTYLDVEGEHYKAKALLEDLEPSSGARSALVAKVAELERERSKIYAEALATRPGSPIAEMDETEPVNVTGSGLVWFLVFAVASWGGVYGACTVAVAVIRRLA